MGHLGVPDQSINPSQSNQLNIQNNSKSTHMGIFEEMLSNSTRWKTLQLLEITIWITNSLSLFNTLSKYILHNLQIILN